MLLLLRFGLRFGFGLGLRLGFGSVLDFAAPSCVALGGDSSAFSGVAADTPERACERPRRSLSGITAPRKNTSRVTNEESVLEEAIANLTEAAQRIRAT